MRRNESTRGLGPFRLKCGLATHPVTIQALAQSDRPWAQALVAQHFATAEMICRGVSYDTGLLPGLVAKQRGERLGLVQYHITGKRCQVIVLVTSRQRQGIGRSLLAELASVVRAQGCDSLWLVTTNDNRSAQTFYQALGWRQVAIHRGAMAAARRLKPAIPERGADGTLIEDELEYELPLTNIARPRQTPSAPR